MVISHNLLATVLRSAPENRGRRQVERLARHLGIDDESSDRELVRLVANECRRVSVAWQLARMRGVA